MERQPPMLLLVVDKGPWRVAAAPTPPRRLCLSLPNIA